MTGKKSILIFIGGIAIIIVLIFTWRGLWGDNPLGSNFDLLTGDGTNDNGIVYCTAKDLGVCKGGIPIIPAAKDTLTLYVEGTEENNHWIIAKTKNKDKSESYWIINKDFKEDLDKLDQTAFFKAISTHVNGPLTLNDFTNKVKESNINLRF